MPASTAVISRVKSITLVFSPATEVRTIFGNITDGLDVAKQINGFMPKSGDGPPTQAVYIDSVTIQKPKTPSPTPNPSG